MRIEVIAFLLVITVVVASKLLPKIHWEMPRLELLKAVGVLERVALPLIGLATLAIVIHYTLPSVWQRWYQGGSNLFWASLLCGAVITVMFAVGSREAKWVGWITVLVLIAGTGYHLWPTIETSFASKGSVPTAVSVQRSSVNVYGRSPSNVCTFQTRTITLTADKPTPIELANCDIWFDVAMDSPSEFLFVRTLDGHYRGKEQVFKRGDSPHVDIYHGSLSFMPKKKRTDGRLVYMLCRQGSTLKKEGCIWNGTLYEPNP